MTEATLVAFAAIAGIMLIGFIGELIFRKFEIPAVILLLGTGFLLGPVYHIVSQDAMRSLQFIVGPLALLVVLFDAGLLLDIYLVIKHSIRPAIFGLLVMALSALLTAGIAYFVLRMDLVVGFLLGVVLGGGAPAITIALLQKIKVDEKVRTLIILESPFTDALCAVLVIVLTNALLGGAAISIQWLGKDLLAIFSISAVVGAVVGTMWVALLNKIEKLTDYVYMATFAMLLLTYIFVEYFGGNGLVASLIFGVIFGNRSELRKMLQLGGEEVESAERLYMFHSEFSFVVRTFFFTYMGLIVTIPAMNVIMMGAVVVAGLYIARLLASSIITLGSSMARYRMFMASFVDRGLPAAVLSTYPLTVVSQSTNPALAALKAQFALFPNIAFVVILLATILSTISITLTKPKFELPTEEDLPVRMKREGEEPEEETKRKMREKLRERMGKAKQKPEEGEAHGEETQETQE